MADLKIDTRRLSHEELEFYREQGYLRVSGVFDPEELAETNAEIDRLRSEKNPSTGQNQNFIFSLAQRSERAAALCADERILALIEDIVRPGIAIYSAKLVEKSPFEDTVCHWHQDDAYYRRISMSSARMSVWIPLQDCDENNGCLWLVPGSHREGFVDTHERRETGVCTLSLRDGAEDIEGAIPCPISAGEVILFDALTWHRSLGNRTGKTRRSFIVSYQDALTTGAARGQHRILRPAPQDEST